MDKIVSMPAYSSKQNTIFYEGDSVRKQNGNFHIWREAKAIAFVASRTTVTVPIIEDVRICDGNSWLLMKRVHGLTLEAACEEMSEAFKSNTAAKLRSILTYLIEPLEDCPKPEWEAKYISQLADNQEIVFSHTDLSSENFMVDPETGDITALLDWEMAGYWPEWWEFRKAMAGSRNRG